MSFFYPSKNELGAGFTVAILFIFLRYLALYTGAAMFLLRLIWFPRLSSTVLYLAFSLLNLNISIAGSLLYFNQQADLAWLHDCLLNGLLAMFMFLFSILLNPRN